MSETKTNYNSEQIIPKTPMAFFWFVSKPSKKFVFWAFLIVLIASIIGSSLAYLFKLVVDAVESQNYTLALYASMAYPIAVFLEQILFRLSAIPIRNWMINAHKFSNDTLSGYVMRHSHGYFVDRFAGSLLSKVNNVSSALDMVIPDSLWTYLTSLVSFFITFCFLLLVDAKIASLFAVLLVILFVVNKSLSKKKMEYSLKLAETRTHYRSRLVDVFANIQAVRQYTQVSNESQSLGSYSTVVAEASNMSWTQTEKILMANTLLIFIFSMITFWILIQGWKAGNVTSGDLVLVLALFTQVTTRLVFMGRAFNMVARTVGEMREGLNDILIPYEINDINAAKPLFLKSATIDWRKVNFDYEGQSVFHDLDLEIPGGQRLGLVGQSGAGKSTFVSLMLRQHNIGIGSIEIDGLDISKVTQDSLRQAIAIVPQEPALFHRTIKENILYGNPDATEEELIEVAKKAQAYDFIMSLPEGFDTMVGERGVKLSGGQKQRVAIARAMLKDAPILILDEATSALDSESEVAIQKALELLMEGRTVIAIAHRLSTLRKMDRIIVMESGEIIEDGNHDSLAKAGGTYERLWNHQAGGFMQDD